MSSHRKAAPAAHSGLYKVAGTNFERPARMVVPFRQPASSTTSPAQFRPSYHIGEYPKPYYLSPPTHNDHKIRSSERKGHRDQREGLRSRDAVAAHGSVAHDAHLREPLPNPKKVDHRGSYTYYDHRNHQLHHQPQYNYYHHFPHPLQHLHHPPHYYPPALKHIAPNTPPGSPRGRTSQAQHQSHQLSSHQPQHPPQPPQSVQPRLQPSQSQRPQTLHPQPLQTQRPQPQVSQSRPSLSQQPVAESSSEESGSEEEDAERTWDAAYHAFDYWVFYRLEYYKHKLRKINSRRKSMMMR